MAKSLGRGLSSLIPPRRSVEKKGIKESDFIDSPVSFSKRNSILEISPDEIEANSKQPRINFSEDKIDELANSIKEYGIIQPLVVTKKGSSYELIVGERRLRAARVAGLKKVPVIVRDVSEQKKLEMALVENLQREDLDPVEKAKAYRQLMDEFGLKVEEVAKRIGKSRPVISNALRLLSLPGGIKDALSGGKISEAHAVNLLGIEPEIKQMNVFRKMVDSKWTVDKARKEIRKIGGTKESRIKADYGDKDKEHALRGFFNTKVEIKRMSKGGKIIIDFYSDDELNNMIDKVK